MADLTLEPFGDKELRIVRIALPEGDGIIPCYVILYRGNDQEFAKVAPAVGLYAEQATRLEYHFASVNEWKKRDQFLIQRKHLSKLTERVAGVTPSYYYRWPGRDVPMQSQERLRVNGEEIAPIPDEAEDFLEHVHKKRGIDRNVLRLAWTAVSREAASWLLKKNRPIDLGFVKLYAFPYRSNWKEILLAKFPNALWWFKTSVKEGKFHDQLAQASFQHELCDLCLRAIHGRDHYIYWTMEAVPSKEWEEDVAEMENLRKSGGNTAYVRYHEKKVADLLPRVLEVFTAYVQKTCRTFPKIQCGSVDGSTKFLPYRGPSEKLPKFGRNIDIRVVSSDGPALGNGNQFKVIQPAFIKGMQNLPRILQAPNDMRRPMEPGEVDESPDGEGGDGGVSVPHADEGEASGQSLLAEHSEQRTNGVEQPIDI